MAQNSKARPKGHPVTRMVELKETPEWVARAIFSAVKNTDPSLRVANLKKQAKAKG